MKCLSKQRRRIRVCTLIACYTATASISGHTGTLVTIGMIMVLTVPPAFCRLWAAWYSGTTAGAKIETCPNAHVVVSTSDDGGQTWREVLVIDPDGAGPLKAVDPRPWVDPEGQLWMIWHLTINGVSHVYQNQRAWAITADDARKANPSWSQPRYIADGVMLNKPMVLANGKWLFTAHDRKNVETGLLKAVVSDDNGHIFKVRGQAEASHDMHAIEPMAVERKNGSLWMLIRTGNAGDLSTPQGIAESFSNDRGVTWTPPLSSAIKHTASRFHISRLQSGSLLLFLWFTVCSSISIAQTKGPLRVHPTNPRYFADASGQAILLTGSHTWNNLVDIGPDDPPHPIDFDAYLRWLQAHGHNFTRGWTWEPTRWDTTAMRNEAWRNGNHHVSPHPWQRTGPGKALDGKPKFDLDQHNPEYLRQLRERLAKAREAGVYVSVMLFEGYGVQFQPDAWPNHPLNSANNVQEVDGDKNVDGKGIEIHQAAKKRVTKIQKEYLRWLVTGLNEFDNLLYEVSNETHPDSTQWQYEVIRFVKEVESSLPCQHPVGMTYQNRRGKNQTLFDSPADWISPNSEGGFRDAPPDQKGTKVVLSDTDHLWGIGGDAVWVWRSFARGLNPIFMDTYDGKVLGNARPQDDGPRRAMGQVLRMSRTIDLATSTPQNELASTGYCLAEPGVSYIVFAPDGGMFTLDLSAASSDFTAEWIDPVDGTRSPAGQAVGGARKTFSAPSDSAVVLFLKRSSQP